MAQSLRAGRDGRAGAAAERPKGPSKLTADKIAEIAAVRSQGLAMRQVAERTGYR
jgi:hypothetical protein